MTITVPEDAMTATMNEDDSSPSCSIDVVGSVSTTIDAPPSQDVPLLRRPIKESSLYVDSLLSDIESSDFAQKGRSRYALGGVSVSRQVTEDHGAYDLTFVQIMGHGLSKIKYRVPV